MERGRPSKYSEETANIIVDITSTTNRSLASICKELEIVPSTVYEWLKHHEDFSNKYARAKEWQADLLAEEILEIADDKSDDITYQKCGEELVKIENREFINRSRLRIDSRKWLASKLKPQKYGEKQSIEHSGEIEITKLTDEQRRERIEQLKQKLNDK